MKNLLCVLLAVVLCFGLTACTDTPDDNNNGITTPSGEQREVQQVGTKYPDKTVGFQLEAPAVGEEIAVMHTNYGDIYIRFFPEAAPKAVKNFKTHAKNGYYNNLIFHRVIANFMIQGGDPKGDGTGGESIYGPKFEDEFDQKLLNLRGSLAMANSGVNTNGSQFFINQATPNDKLRENMEFTDAELDVLRENIEEQYKALINDYGKDVVEKLYGTLQQQLNSNMPVYDSASISKEVWDLYEKTGGNLHLDGAFRFEGGHTVFGQVFQGMDVVDRIAAVNVDPNYKPKENVIIQSIDVIPYQG